MDNQNDIAISELIHWTLTALLGGIIAVIGFFVKQIWTNTKELEKLKQDLKDLRETIQRLHLENLQAHEDIIDRLK